MNCSSWLQHEWFGTCRIWLWQGTNFFQTRSVKALCSKRMWSIIHGCKQSWVFEWGAHSGTWQNWAQNFATVQSYVRPESIPRFPLPGFHHFSLSSADDGSKEMLGDLSPADYKDEDACSVLHATPIKKSLKLLTFTKTSSPSEGLPNGIGAVFSGGPVSFGTEQRKPTIADTWFLTKLA